MRIFMKVALWAGIAMALAGQVLAQTGYPNRPIKLIVPFPAGSSSDAVARIMATPMANALGQPIVIDNKGGADGAIGGDIVARSAPDGYTLFVGTNSPMAAVPILRKNPPYNSTTDFTPISFVGRTTFYLLVNSDLQIRSLESLLAYARANPGKLNYASSNTTGIVAMAQLLSLGGVLMQHVPYKGEAAAMLDLVANRVQVMFASPTTAASFMREGRIVAIATTNLARSQAAPTVPTMSEAGMPRFSIGPWVALFGPANMSREIVDRLSREVFAAFARPDVMAQMDKQEFPAQASRPEELAKFLKEQLDVWRKAAADAGIQPE